MFPSETFYDLVDSKVAFDVTLRNLNGPDYVFKVTRPAKGEVSLRVGKESIRGPAAAIHVRLSALLCTTPGLHAHTIENTFAPCLDDGMICRYEINPELAGVRRGFPASIPVEACILIGDYPTAELETAVVTVQIGKRERMYLFELVDKDSMRETIRLSPSALPEVIHAKLAAAGHYEDSYLAMYGQEALDDACSQSEEVRDVWEGRMLSALGRR